MTITLHGDGTPVEIVVPPVDAHLPPLRTQVDIPLTPDLPGGQYTLSAQVGATPPGERGGLHPAPARRGRRPVGRGHPPPRGLPLGRGDPPDRLRAARARGPGRRHGGAGPSIGAPTRRSPTGTRSSPTLLGETFNAETETFLWGQQDNEPGMGQAITPLWAPGAIIADPYHIAVDPQAPPGTYTLEVGMYGLVNGVRLPVEGPDGPVPNNAILLAGLS